MDTKEQAKEFWKRTNNLLRQKGFTQESLSVACNFAPNSINNWTAKKIFPNALEVFIIAQKLDTTVEYLITGQGPKLTIDASKLSRFIDENKDLFVRTEITGDIGFNPSISPDK